MAENFNFFLRFCHQLIHISCFVISAFDYSQPRCYYSCPCAVMRNLDAIIRVRMLLCETSMLLFVFRIMFVLIRVLRELDRYGYR